MLVYMQVILVANIMLPFTYSFLLFLVIMLRWSAFSSVNDDRMTDPRLVKVSISCAFTLHSGLSPGTKSPGKMKAQSKQAEDSAFVFFSFTTMVCHETTQPWKKSSSQRVTE